ncbi:MAG: hypothetical protein IIC61_06810 [Proteobacteria bacterium]|nr:hypothetical protein [Pseudomonadota bacterium]
MPSRYSMLTAVAILLSGPALAGSEELLSDPTRPWSAKSSVAAPTSAAGFRVTAIFTSEMRRIAIVNGQRVSEGDQVDGATVVEILADSCRLDLLGKAITTRVLPIGFRH